METLSGCVDCNHRPAKASRCVDGNVLAVLLAAVVVLGLIGGALFEIANAGRERALKIQYRDRAVAGTEFRLEAIRQSAVQQFRQQARFDVANLGINLEQAHGSKEPGYYNLELWARAPANQISATQTHNAIERLSAPDDPFRGLAAVVNSFIVTANAYSTLPNATAERFSLPSLTLTPEISVRQIPVSEFTLFSSSASFPVQAPLMPIVGRIHSEGDLVISGGEYISIYPVTAGGNVSLANNGSLLAQSGPSEPQLSFPVASTIDNDWLAMSRGIARSTILSGRDLPMTTVEAADFNRLTAQDSSSSPSSPIAQQELWRQCSRIVLENNGEISVTTVSGAAVSSQEKRAFTYYYSRHNPDRPVIIFNVSKAPPSAGRNSFYISSSNFNAVVLLTKASNLPDGLAIVSPLAIAIEGGFNDQGVRKAASITAKSVSVVPVSQ
ncbi:MAG: hypothetical protein JO334_06395 [Verrucomicrobia bacterium]|nr:hypothetical protein [Verrucomicrobiota bacterium]